MPDKRPWAVAKYAGGINWIDMLSDPPDKGQEIIVYIPYSFNQVRHVKSYDPDDRILQMTHAWAPVKYPFKIGIYNDEKPDDQIEMPF